MPKVGLEPSSSEAISKGLFKVNKLRKFKAAKEFDRSVRACGRSY